MAPFVIILLAAYARRSHVKQALAIDINPYIYPY
jgi:hypothetical protein